MSPIRKAWIIALIFAALRVAFIAHVDLAEDEAYYWEWSRSLDLSYYDQGPLLAWAIRAGTDLLGTNEVGVRAPAVLGALAVSGMAIEACAVELALPALAPWMVLAFNAMLLFAVGSVLMMHDSLLGLCWMAAVLAALKARRNPRWWLLAGAAAGLGFTGKYTGVLLFLCLGLYALARPQERQRVGRSPWFWLGGALGSLGAVPVLLWNLRHQWPSFQHVFALAGGDASRRGWQTPVEFLGSQIGLVTPILFGLVLTAWAWAWRRRRTSPSGEWLLFCVSAPIFFFFLLLSLRTRIEGNWPAQAYLGGLLLTGLWLESSGRRQGPWARWAVGLALGMAVLVHAQVGWPFLPIPASSAKLDTGARVDGWRELGQRVQAERVAMGGAFVAARTYQNAAELGFYLPDHARVLIIQDGVINHQYRFWNDPASHAGANAILVVGQSWELGEMGVHFNRIEALPDFVFMRHGIEVRRRHLYRAWGFHPPVPLEPPA